MNRHIRALDRSLARSGEDVILRRIVGTTAQVNIDCPARAHVRGYEPSQLAGSIIQGDRQVIMSPTDIDRAQWPGGQPVTSPAPAADPRIPVNGDRVIIQGQSTVVIAADPVVRGGVLVRINIQVRG